MRVGINYPWVDYGWDFGVAPSSWRRPDAEPRWLGLIDDDLRRFQGLGISVVRWFILADGLTYGHGNDAPWEDPVRPDVWHFEPPRVSAEALEHFEALLLRFERANEGGGPAIQLLPVLIDFHFCQMGNLPVALGAAGTIASHGDPGWVKQGRAEAIVEADKRRRFLDGVLDPLLRVSQAHAAAIFAWELINEPEWVTRGWHPDGQEAHPVDAASMRAFLEEGKSRIRQAAILPTIGFALIDTLRRTGITAEINQFHHYPDGWRTLESHVFSPLAPGIIGEFATRATDRWPELPPEQQTVLHRLRVAAQRGYPLALPWCYRQVDRHAEWTAAVERDFDTFAREQPGAMIRAEAVHAEPRPGEEPMVEVSVPLRCAAGTARGTRCRRRAMDGSLYCWQHQPAGAAISALRTRP